MRVVDEFYNKSAKFFTDKYFPDIDHGLTDDKNYRGMRYALECFNNGVISYDKLVKRLSKYCKSTMIENELNKFIHE